VKIIVSEAPNQQTFVVHKELLCFHSPFFERAFYGNLKENKTQKMHLDDVEGPVFGLLVAWVYKEKIEVEDPQDQDSCTPFEPSNTLLFAKLWKFAERCMMPTLQNAAMDKLLMSLFYLTPDTMLKLAQYAYLHDAELIKRVIVRDFCWRSNDKLFNEVIGKIPAAMVVDVAKILKRFHSDHEDEYPCGLGYFNYFHVKVGIAD
jgi:hypothetical protein